VQIIIKIIIGKTGNPSKKVANPNKKKIKKIKSRKSKQKMFFVWIVDLKL
jgi:hypothetical protein